MKKTISILLALAMVLLLTACVSLKVVKNPFEKAKEPEPAITEAPTAEPTAEPTPEPTAEPTPEPTVEPTLESTAEPTPEPIAEPAPEPAPTEVPAAAILGEANEKLKEVKSFHMDMDLTMDMEMTLAMGILKQGIPADVRVALKANMTRDPDLFRGEMDMTAVGETANALIYGAKDGESIVIYTSTNRGSSWQKQVDPQGGQLFQTPGDTLGLLLEGETEIQRVGTMDLNGKSVAAYAGKVSGKRLREIVESTGALGEMGETMHLDLPDVVLEELSDIDVTILIDEDSGLPVKGTVEMTAAMRELMAAIVTASMAEQDMEGVEIEMDVSTAVLTITLSDFDAVEPIVIPEAALNAPEA